jgi:mono/diheme cytochrome c family protein
VRTLRALTWWVLGVVIVAGLAGWAAASPVAMGAIRQAYAPKEGSALASANCLVCHDKMPPTKTGLNPYGQDVAKAAAGKPIDAKVLASIERLDSDKDGASNGVELKAGTLPGDPSSKPR